MHLYESCRFSAISLAECKKVELRRRRRSGELGDCAPPALAGLGLSESKIMAWFGCSFEGVHALHNQHNPTTSSNTLSLSSSTLRSPAMGAPQPAGHIGDGHVRGAFGSPALWAKVLPPSARSSELTSTLRWLPVTYNDIHILIGNAGECSFSVILLLLRCRERGEGQTGAAGPRDAGRALLRCSSR